MKRYEIKIREVIEHIFEVEEFNDGKRSHISAINTLYKIAYDFHKPSLIKAREELRIKRIRIDINYDTEFNDILDEDGDYVKFEDIEKVLGK